VFFGHPDQILDLAKERQADIRRLFDRDRMTSSAARPLARAALVPTVAGLMLTLLLAALDSTIVATAMPTMAVELRSLERYSWVTVAYLLTSTVSVPIVGKLVDVYGIRRFLLGGTLVFLGASVLCGLAATLEQLVAFRLLQGAGAGAITASVFAAVPALFSPAARAQLIGLFTGTYGLASIVGPLLGGVITDLVGWRGVFWVNVPIALAALALVVPTYPSVVVHRTRRSVDVLGALALIGGLTPLLLALLFGGHAVAWDSLVIAALLTGGVLLLAAFVWIERRAAEPIIPLRQLTTRTLGMPLLGSALMNAGLLATVLFTPLFAQRVVGQTATASGGGLAPMMVAWVLASIIAGNVIARSGQTRPTAVVGMATATVGLTLMAGMGSGTESVVLARNLVITGSGLGAAVASFVLAGGNALPVDQAGVATSLTTFARAIGATMCSAALGGLLTTGVGGATAADPFALAAALDRIFAAVAIVLAAGLVAALLLRDSPSPQSETLAVAPAPTRY
jgi:EmrB/QacA subfamily drug resistance transporter